MQLVVVEELSPKDQKTPTRVRHVFDDYHVKLFKTDEISQLIDEIRQTGMDVFVA